MCPRTKTLWCSIPLSMHSLVNASLGRCVPWSMHPLVDASLGCCVPGTVRPWPMCPDPRPHTEAEFMSVQFRGRILGIILRVLRLALEVPGGPVRQSYAGINFITPSQGLWIWLLVNKMELFGFENRRKENKQINMTKIADCFNFSLLYETGLCRGSWFVASTRAGFSFSSFYLSSLNNFLSSI